MDKKLLYVIAGFDAATEEYLNSLKIKLHENGFGGSQTDIFNHITLCSFEVERENEIVEKIKSVAQKTKKFDINFNSVGLFADSEVIFINPNVNKELLELEENFCNNSHWTAHATMLIDKPHVIYKALPILLENFEEFQGQVQSLHLYEFFPSRHIITLPLL